MKKLLFCLVLWIPAARTAFSQPVSPFTGKITDNEGHPVPGAVIKVINTGFEVIADDQGKFTIEHIPPGKYTLQITSAGFAALSRETVIPIATGPLTLKL